MTKEWGQHIGDDQLVYGMPKHMSAVAGEDITTKSRMNSAQMEQDKSRQSKKFDPKGNYYWTVHPKPKACDTCKAMEGEEFMEEPERPHPNCKCEIKKHPLRRPTRYINGSLTGHAYVDFTGGSHVEISFEGISGGITSGVHLTSNHGHSEQIACMPFSSNSTSLDAGQTPPVDWQISLVAAGSDNVMINYTVVYEEWNE